MNTIQKFYFAGAGLLTLACASEGGLTAAFVMAGVTLLASSSQLTSTAEA
jgi:hypothetical protein